MTVLVGTCVRVEPEIQGGQIHHRAGPHDQGKRVGLTILKHPGSAMHLSGTLFAAAVVVIGLTVSRTDHRLIVPITSWKHFKKKRRNEVHIFILYGKRL